MLARFLSSLESNWSSLITSRSRSGTVSGSTFSPYGGANTHHFAYVNGQEVGDVDEAGGINVASTLTGFTSGAGTGSYLVQGGDTLASIAQSMYGNSNLGYVIAAANGFSGDGDLVTGQRITIPVVTTTSNTASTFKPYNPGQIVGSTMPSLAAAPPPPPASQHCSALAEIVAAAVVVIASIYTAGLAAEAMAGTLGTAAGGGAAGVMSAGAAAMSGGLAGTAAVGAAGSFVGTGLAVGGTEAIGAAAIGGMAGSIAGQFAGDSLGISHGFSIGQVLEAGLTAAAGSALGGGLKASGAAALYAGNELQPAGAALQGAGSYAANVISAKVTGQAEHFSWAGVVGAAVGSGVTSAASLPSESLQQTAVASENVFESLAGGVLSEGLARETTLSLGDDHVKSWATILEDAFGNALGNAVIAGINAYQANQLPPIPVDASTTQMSISAPGVVVQNIPQTIAPVALVTPVDAQALLSPSDGLANAGTPTVAGQGATQWPSAADVPLISGVTIKPNGVYYEGLHRRAR